MSYGYAHGISHWIVVVANMLIETFMVLLCYALFVFSYKKLFVIKPLEDIIERTQRAAKARQATIRKYGIPGLLIFVWIPFWGTGPVVGAIIGFLIGLSPWVNLATVLAGTYVAILCWGTFLKGLTDYLGNIGPSVALAFAGTIIIIAVAVHLRYALFDHTNGSDGTDKTDSTGSSR
jgi:uncharacterized membrane protein